MTKTLFFMTDEKGFVLPYTLFFIALAFIIITANINQYQNEIRITQHQTEQVKIETLFQMARAQFMEDAAINQAETNGKTTYVFPYGDVVVQSAKLSDLKYHLYFKIQTDTGAVHSIFNRTVINSE